MQPCRYCKELTEKGSCSDCLKVQRRKRKGQPVQLSLFPSTRPSKTSYIRAIKEEQGCKCCGERNSIVLDFHHKNPETKTRSISEMISNKVSFFSILEELDKCEILCSNCHRLNHVLEV